MTMELIVELVRSTLGLQEDPKSYKSECTILKIPILRNDPVNFSVIFDAYIKQGLNINGSQILQFNEIEEKYVLLGIFIKGEMTFNIIIPENGIIKLKYRRLTNDMIKSLTIKQEKQQKKKEHVIKEAVYLVRCWEKLSKPLGKKKVMSLTKAASSLGVSVKTLNEYRQQINLGIENDFDFEYFQDNSMGILRQFNMNPSK